MHELSNGENLQAAHLKGKSQQVNYTRRMLVH